jgi:hypothetical protein
MDYFIDFVVFRCLEQDNKFHNVLQHEQVPTILQELHSGVGGGHCFSNIMVRKILDADYWWPTMSKNVHEFYWTCDLCQ